MVTDRGRSDDAQACDDVPQPTGLAHIQRSISAVLARKSDRARHLGEGLKARRQDALPRWHAYHDGAGADFVTEANALRDERTDQLRHRCLPDADHQRLLNEWGWHHDRGNWVRCLDDPRIEPTHNRAARALRPAVIARQVSHGSKNGAGAHGVEAFTSVVRPLVHKGTDSLVQGLYQLCRRPGLQVAPP
jgi:hypothetical protein